MSGVQDILLIWSGPKPPLTKTQFQEQILELYGEACTQRPQAAGFLMCLKVTVLPVGLHASYPGPVDFHSILVVSLGLDGILQVLEPLQADVILLAGTIPFFTIPAIF